MRLEQVQGFVNEIKHDATRRAFEALIEMLDKAGLDHVVADQEEILKLQRLEDENDELRATLTEVAEEADAKDSDLRATITEIIGEEDNAIQIASAEGVSEDQSPGDLQPVEEEVRSGDSEEDGEDKPSELKEGFTGRSNSKKKKKSKS